MAEIELGVVCKWPSFGRGRYWTGRVSKVEEFERRQVLKVGGF